MAKILIGAAVAYALSPIDLVPDFIPVVGHLDDVVVVPLLIIVALKLIPKDVVEECRATVKMDNELVAQVPPLPLAKTRFGQ